MKAYELRNQVNDAITQMGFGGEEITVHLPGLGSAYIEGVIWHTECNEFHILLKTKNCEHKSITWKGPEGNRVYTCDACGRAG